MINLITIIGESAPDFYLDKQRIPDFKSVLRSLTSSRVLVVSTKFRTDLFYNSSESMNSDIMKIWGLYTTENLSGFQKADVKEVAGDEASLSDFFNAINILSSNWYKYGIYRETFQEIFDNDQQNPIAMKVVQCDQYLIEHTKTDRIPLVNSDIKLNPKMTEDTLSLAMSIIESGFLSN